MIQPVYLNHPTCFAPDLALNHSEEAIKMHLPKRGKIVLPVMDLMFLQATGNYSWLHWKDGQRMLLPRTLKYYEPQLPHALFVRPHHSCIVNVRYIERMERLYPDKGGLIHLRSGVSLPVSRRRWLSMIPLYKHLQAGSV
ncbi:hypothetical protein GCM10028803_29790 [Larkinella knui]|uniref:LytTR family transcriptional regulator n=1 Tax=Larkinella knui TaxID=2025310 RepID=A0A3P1CY38_9BACT|nr:LytTR family DNA-binding domain-containing protein [Larkinella knui]RRB18010.1 LytTR family transcriptional regulator [Larkinella knui]